jgi:hypothetical protein
MFRQLLGWLLCILILSAALDKVPDPPVIKPHRDKSGTVCLISPHQPIDRGVSEVAPGPTPPLYRFDTSWQCESKRLLPAEPLLLQAADSSPPISLL